MVKTQFENEGLDLRQSGEAVAGVQEGQTGLLCDTSFCGVWRDFDMETRPGECR